MELLGVERLMFPEACVCFTRTFTQQPDLGWIYRPLKNNNTNLFAALGISCSLHDLRCLIWDLSSWPMGSPVVARGLSSAAMDGTDAPCIAKWILNLWTTRQVPTGSFQGSWCSR